MLQPFPAAASGSTCLYSHSSDLLACTLVHGRPKPGSFKGEWGHWHWLQSFHLHAKCISILSLFTLFTSIHYICSMYILMSGFQSLFHSYESPSSGMISTPTDVQALLVWPADLGAGFLTSTLIGQVRLRHCRLVVGATNIRSGYCILSL